jgi:hypothetical protein
MNNCPCNKCICVPICKNKQYPSLMVSCKLIRNYLNPFFSSNPERLNGRLKLIQKALKPTMWILIYDKHGRVMVDNYTGYKQCHFYY